MALPTGTDQTNNTNPMLEEVLLLEQKCQDLEKRRQDLKKEEEESKHWGKTTAQNQNRKA